jgi:hypothetical protein
MAYRHYGSYGLSLRRNTFPSNKPSRRQERPGKLHIPVEVVPILIIASFLPVWRSGLKYNLTFWGFIYNHTVFAPDPEFLPREDYAGIFAEET